MGDACSTCSKIKVTESGSGTGTIFPDNKSERKNITSEDVKDLIKEDVPKSIKEDVKNLIKGDKVKE